MDTNQRGYEEEVEVEVEAVWDEDEDEDEEVEAEELDPRTLGVPGLKTLMPGDRVEVLWRHGASSLPMLALIRITAAPKLQPHRRRCRLGEGASDRVRARDAGRPARHHLSPRIRRRRKGKPPRRNCTPAPLLDIPQRGSRARICTTSRTPSQQAEDLRMLRVRRVGEEMPVEDVEDVEAACTWVQCDRCRKWRRLDSNDELPDEWWCELNGDVRDDTRTKAQE